MSAKLKADLMAKWIEAEWIPNHPEHDWVILWTTPWCAHDRVTPNLDKNIVLKKGFHFDGTEPVPCRVVSRTQHRWQGWSGAYLYRFRSQDDPEKRVEALVLSSFWSDSGGIVTLVCIPKQSSRLWYDFADECERIYHALNPQRKIHIIGGRLDSFEPTVEWDDVVLPEELKSDLLHDVDAFYKRGIQVYKRLKLKPFRKMLLAGVPGTGKTMLCSALGKWALDQGYLVVYISSVDMQGATFHKIEQALQIVANSRVPALIILEEIDAYLHDKQKAMVLNVLDGAESAVNDHGTLLIATTNYPEAIDERVLKRPGRLDRIFIIPEVRQQEDAEKMLRRYLGELWREEHRGIVPKLVGFPGAFIREVAIYAMTQVALDAEQSGDAIGDADILPELPLEALEDSFKRLKAQLDMRDDFLLKPRTSIAFNLNTNGAKN
jgi:DNA replication protein DnaC